jgi:hypothetical protein
MITLFIGALGDVFAWLLEKTFLARFFMKPSPEQSAVNTETAMAQAVADAPDQSEAVKELRDDKV